MAAGAMSRDLRVIENGAKQDRSVVIRDLYLARYDELVRLARLLVKPSEAAEEVVQEAFARTYAAWDRVTDQTDPYGYVRTCVVNLSRQNMRRRAIVARHPEPPPTSAPAAEDLALARSASADVFAALDELPARQRACVVLRLYEGCSVAETASLLGIGEGSVKTHTHRGRAALDERLRPHHRPGDGKSEPSKVPPRAGSYE